MGTMTVSGASAGLATGQKVIGPITTTGNNTIGTILDVTLVSGDNVLTVPTGASKVLINLGQGVPATVAVRTNLNSGDAGLPIGPYTTVGWTAFDLVSGVTTITLNSSTTLTGVELSFV